MDEAENNDSRTRSEDFRNNDQKSLNIKKTIQKIIADGQKYIVSL